jgi:hypothetical protein
MLPPTEPPVIQTMYELRSGRDFFFDKPIVPQGLQGLEPRFQWDAYTSEFAKFLGDKLNISPKYIDHAVTGFGTSWGRQILTWSNQLAPNAPEQGLADGLITKRFVKYVSRGANSTRQFWELMAKNGGVFDAAANTYKEMFVKRDLSGAPFLADKDKADADFAIHNGHFHAEEKRLHPLRRARDATLTIAKLRREIRGGDVIMTEPGRKAPTLTPSLKLAVDNVLSYMQMVEHRNALVYTGVRGWKEKKIMETAPVWEELKAASPVLHKELRDRYRKAKVYSEAGVRKAWPEAYKRLLADGSNAQLSDLVSDAKAASF